MEFLPDNLYFFKEGTFDNDGPSAMSANLSPHLVLYYYPLGFFPWVEEHNMFYWFNPPQRMVLFPERIKISKSMRNVLNQKKFTVTQNKAFTEVVLNCAKTKRKDQDSTWITQEFIKVYIELFDRGHAHSIEVWQDQQLVGGLYGLKMGSVFFGESMFSEVTNASKVAFIHLAKSGICKLVDCQIPTAHLKSLGAEEMSKDDFLKLIQEMFERI